MTQVSTGLPSLSILAPGLAALTDVAADGGVSLLAFDAVLSGQITAAAVLPDGFTAAMPDQAAIVVQGEPARPAKPTVPLIDTKGAVDRDVQVERFARAALTDADADPEKLDDVSFPDGSPFVMMVMAAAQPVATATTSGKTASDLPVANPQFTKQTEKQGSTPVVAPDAALLKASTMIAPAVPVPDGRQVVAAVSFGWSEIPPPSDTPAIKLAPTKTTPTDWAAGVQWAVRLGEQGLSAVLPEAGPFALVPQMKAALKEGAAQVPMPLSIQPSTVSSHLSGDELPAPKADLPLAPVLLAQPTPQTPQHTLLTQPESQTPHPAFATVLPVPQTPQPAFATVLPEPAQAPVVKAAFAPPNARVRAEAPERPAVDAKLLNVPAPSAAGRASVSLPLPSAPPIAFPQVAAPAMIEAEAASTQALHTPVSGKELMIRSLWPAEGAKPQPEPAVVAPVLHGPQIAAVPAAEQEEKMVFQPQDAPRKAPPAPERAEAPMANPAAPVAFGNEDNAPIPRPPVDAGVPALGVSASPHAVPSVHAQRAEGALPPSAPAPSVPLQIVQAAANSPNGVTEIRLAPEELGQVRLEIRSDGDRVVMVVSAERQDTLDLLRRHADQLASEMRQAGHQGLDLSFGRWSGPGAESGARADQNPQDTSPADAEKPPLQAPTSNRPTLRPDLPALGLYLRI